MALPSSGFGNSGVQPIMGSIDHVVRLYSLLFSAGQWEAQSTIHTFKRFKTGWLTLLILIFIFTEGFNSLINNVESKGDLKGLVVTRRGINISNLLFANDIIYFVERQRLNGVESTKCLTYMKGNRDKWLTIKKSSIFFSTNTSLANLTAVIEAIGGVISRNYDKYLGLPILIGRSR